MTIANIDGSNDTAVDLYLKNAGADTYYILKGVTIPLGVFQKSQTNCPFN